jgi:L-threonylcarbamoyladenylate synthase
LRTKILQVPKAGQAREEALGLAAAAIRGGRLVAFPTETVYGLGANALCQEAVEEIFKAKGRPQDNPLIVHVDSTGMAQSVWGELSTAWQEQFHLLAEHFWPGPLTLIGPVAPHIPLTVTAGLDTVAVRMPDHPVALGLIRKSGLPIAAPSANRSGKPSPTRAGHVLEDLEGKVEIILDGGPTTVGLESTVLDLTDQPTVLRPGGITIEELEKVLGPVGYAGGGKAGERVRSPGMKYRHYSPDSKVLLVEGPLEGVLDKMEELLAQEKGKGKRVGILASREALAQKEFPRADLILLLGERRAPETVGANLFDHFRTFDHRGVDVVIMEGIEPQGLGLAVMNRAKRAASSVITIE